MKIQPFSTINSSSSTEKTTIAQNSAGTKLNLLDKIAPLLNNVEKFSKFFNISNKPEFQSKSNVPSSIPSFDDDYSPQSLTNPSPLHNIGENQRQPNDNNSPNIINNILSQFLNFGNQTEPKQSDYTPPTPSAPSARSSQTAHPWQKEVSEKQLYRSMLIHQDKLSKLRK